MTPGPLFQSGSIVSPATAHPALPNYLPATDTTQAPGTRSETLLCHKLLRFAGHSAADPKSGLASRGHVGLGKGKELGKRKNTNPSACQSFPDSMCIIEWLMKFHVPGLPVIHFLAPLWVRFILLKVQVNAAFNPCQWR